jgi:hypothetical protein
MDSKYHLSPTGVVLALILWLPFAVGARAQSNPQPVDLALVLAVDASGSIDDQRWILESQGYAQAFRNPDVLKAIQSGPIGAIAVTLVEWSTQYEKSQVIGWTVVSDATSADQLSGNLAELARVFREQTSIREGLRFGAQLLDKAPYAAARRVIDVSGDGPDNSSGGDYLGTPADAAALRAVRDQIVGEGITINGLPIFGDPHVTHLDDYYMANVIGGPSSFMIVAESFDSFATAIEKKLVEEIADANRARGPLPG